MCSQMTFWTGVGLFVEVLLFGLAAVVLLSLVARAGRRVWGIVSRKPAS